MNNIVIIGNGIAGVTTARHIRKLDSEARITIISSETEHFFSRTALMYIYMGHMKYKDTKPYEDWFWKKNRIDLIKAHVTSVDFKNKKLTVDIGDPIDYDKLVIATGSTPNKFGWSGENLDGVQGLYSYQDLLKLEANTALTNPNKKSNLEGILDEKLVTSQKKVQRAVLIGGGLIGVEFAEMLLYRGIKVTFLVREDRFWGGVLPKEEGDMISQHIKNDHHVDLRLEEELEAIIPDENGRVKEIKTKKGEIIPCELVGLTAGVRPNIDFLRETELNIEKGIRVNKYLETNIENVYAIGDCAEVIETVPGRRAIEAVWYVGRMMGETLARTLTGNKLAYQPGVWFNSAKFFDIEYQTYGIVSAKPKDDEKTFFWRHPKKNISFRAVSDNRSKALKGINVFGIRLRHEICEKWIKDKVSIEQVLSELKNANFDPEFFKQYEEDIILHYNKLNNTNLRVKKKNILSIFGN